MHEGNAAPLRLVPPFVPLPELTYDESEPLVSASEGYVKVWALA